MWLTSAAMHVVERWRRIDADTLEYRATVEDPEHADHALGDTDHHLEASSRSIESKRRCAGQRMARDVSHARLGS